MHFELYQGNWELSKFMLWLISYNSNDRKDFSMLMVACAVVDQLSTLVDKGELVYHCRALHRLVCYINVQKRMPLIDMESEMLLPYTKLQHAFIHIIAWIYRTKTQAPVF